MRNKKWSNKEINKLTQSYGYLSKEEVLHNFPNYKWRNLQNIANSMGIKRFVNGKRKGKINKLFNNSNESFYWLGLIIADGYISHDGELKVALAIKDYDYLKKLALFLECGINTYPPYKNCKPNSTGICRVKIKDINEGVKLRNLLRINGKKTYNPISIDFIKNKDEMISLFAGHIDGDGTITKKGKISIDAHINYYNYFINFGDKLKQYNIITKFNVIKYENMSRISFTIYDSLSIKKKLLNLGLPIMKRKWDRVSDTKKIKNYLVEHQDVIMKMRKSGKTYKEICEEINYKSVGTLCSFIKYKMN